jgi:hypothetical protein
MVTNQQQHLRRTNSKGGILVSTYHLVFNLLLLDGNNGQNKALVTMATIDTTKQVLLDGNDCFEDRRA